MPQEIIVVESKFAQNGHATLGKRAGNVTQMDDRWIRNKVAEMMDSSSDAVKRTGELLKNNDYMIRREINVLDGQGINHWDRLRPPPAGGFQT